MKASTVVSWIPVIREVVELGQLIASRIRARRARRRRRRRESDCTKEEAQP